MPESNSAGRGYQPCLDDQPSTTLFKSGKKLAELLQAEGWDIKAQRISTIKSKLKAEQKSPPAASPVVPKKAPTPKADDAISFDSLKKAKQMAEQLGGIQQAKAALAALAELVD